MSVVFLIFEISQIHHPHWPDLLLVIVTGQDTLAACLVCQTELATPPLNDVHVFWLQG